MRVFVAIACTLALAACGGGNRASSGSSVAATGEISRACLAGGRTAASPALCTCIQGVANAQLSSSDRGRIAKFFAEPETAHAVRISDTEADDAFWARYQRYVDSARQQCS